MKYSSVLLADKTAFLVLYFLIKQKAFKNKKDVDLKLALEAISKSPLSV